MRPENGSEDEGVEEEEETHETSTEYAQELLDDQFGKGGEDEE